MHHAVRIKERLQMQEWVTPAVLEQVLASAPAPGTAAVMIAMGPGFCSELVLLRF